MMTIEMTIKIHEVATDGLPGMSDVISDLPCRVALIWGGSVVSGWPLRNQPAPNTGDKYWEGDDDVSRRGKFGGVTHWLEFPTTLFLNDLDKAKTDAIQSSREKIG